MDTRAHDYFLFAEWDMQMTYTAKFYYLCDEDHVIADVFAPGEQVVRPYAWSPAEGYAFWNAARASRARHDHHHVQPDEARGAILDDAAGVADDYEVDEEVQFGPAVGEGDENEDL